MRIILNYKKNYIDNFFLNKTKHSNRERQLKNEGKKTRNKE